MYGVITAIVIIFIMIILGGILAASEEAAKQHRADQEAAKQHFNSLPTIVQFYEGPCPLCCRQIRVGNVEPRDV